MHPLLRRFVPGLAVLGTLALLAPPASAQQEAIRTPGRFGLGLGMGTLANGLSAKYFIDRQHALQFHLGEFGGGGPRYRWHRFRGLALGADYLFEGPRIVRAGKAFDLAWNIGGGVGLGFGDRYYGFSETRSRLACAVAFVAGLEFNFIPIPLDIVLEWRPGLLVVPHVRLGVVDFTAQIRVYF